MAQGAASGGAAGGSAVRAGRAFVELFQDDTALVRGLEQNRRKLEGFGRTTQGIGLKVAGIGGAIAAPLAASFASLAGRDKQIGDIADRYRSTAESVSALAFAFERSGVGMDEFGGTVDAFAGKMFAAFDGADESFRRIGLNARSMVGLPVTEQMTRVADALTRVKLESDRAQLAQDLFGSAGLKLLPTLRQGAAGFRDLADEARAAGAVVSAEDAKKAQADYKEYTATVQSLKYAFLELGKALLPTADEIKGFAADVRDGVGRVREFIERNGDAVRLIARVAAASIAAGVALKTFGSAISIGAAALGVFTLALKVTLASIGLVLSGLGLIPTALLAIGIAFAAQTQTARRFAADLGGLFGTLGETAGATFQGVADALRANDLTLAAKVAWAGLKVAWAEFEGWFVVRWNDFKSTFVDGWHDIVGAAKIVLKDLIIFLMKYLYQPLGQALGGWAIIGDKAGLDTTALKRAADALGATADIDRMSRDAEQGIGADRAKRQADADRARAADAAAAAARADAARKELFDLKLMAGTARPGPQGAGSGATGLGGLGFALRAATKIGEEASRWGRDVIELPRASKGAFSGPLGQQLGYGDAIATRSILKEGNKLQERGNDIAQGVVKEITKLNDRLAFK